jgi:hypothetical protein
MERPRIDNSVGKWGKADFDKIYNAADPREYFRVLYGLDYVIPELAKSVFDALIDHSLDGGRKRLKILDIGSSYGINSALIRYPLDLHRLAQRYASNEMYGQTPEDVIRLDRHYFSSWPCRENLSFVGVDTAAPAIDYARAVGLIEGGVTTNLEERDPTAKDRALLKGADLIISTGCVGYVSGRTFERLLAAQDPKRPPTIASLVLRMFSYDEIAASFAAHGMVTEKLGGVTFVQRRFISSDEYEAAMDRLTARGVDPTGKEAEGLMHAELYVTRAAGEVERAPLRDIVSITSGAHRRYGRRFRRLDGERAMLMH